MRERAKTKAANKGAQFRGANVGFSLRLTQNMVPTEQNQAPKNYGYYDDGDNSFFQPANVPPPDAGVDDQGDGDDSIPLEVNSFKVRQSTILVKYSSMAAYTDMQLHD